MKIEILPFRWFFKSAKVYSPFIVIKLFSGGAFLSISVYYLDSVRIVYKIDSKFSKPPIQFVNKLLQQLEHIDSSLALTLFASSTGLCILFPYCYFGSLATASFENMSDALFESNWRNFPVALQQYLIIMIAVKNNEFGRRSNRSWICRL